MVAFLAVTVPRVIDEDVSNGPRSHRKEMCAILPRRFLLLAYEADECFIHELCGLKCMPLAFTTHRAFRNAMEVPENRFREAVGCSGYSIFQVLEDQGDFHRRQPYARRLSRANTRFGYGPLATRPFRRIFPHTLQMQDIVNIFQLMIHLASPASAPREAAVLAKAVIAAAARLGLRNRQLAEIIGASEASVSRLKGGRDLVPSTKEGELALIFLRLYRSLDALVGGDDAKARAWLQAGNDHLGGVPADRIRTVEGLVDVVQYLDAMRGRL